MQAFDVNSDKIITVLTTKQNYSKFLESIKKYFNSFLDKRLIDRFYRESQFIIRRLNNQ